MTEPMFRIIITACKLVAETIAPSERTETSARALIPYSLIDELDAALRDAGISVRRAQRAAMALQQRTFEP